jgi:hypothetical protein
VFFSMSFVDNAKDVVLNPADDLTRESDFAGVVGKMADGEKPDNGAALPSQNMRWRNPFSSKPEPSAPALRPQPALGALPQHPSQQLQAPLSDNTYRATVFRPMADGRYEGTETTYVQDGMGTYHAVRDVNVGGLGASPVQPELLQSPKASTENETSGWNPAFSFPRNPAMRRASQQNRGAASPSVHPSAQNTQKVAATDFGGAEVPAPFGHFTEQSDAARDTPAVVSTSVSSMAYPGAKVLSGMKVSPLPKASADAIVISSGGKLTKADLSGFAQKELDNIHMMVNADRLVNEGKLNAVDVKELETFFLQLQRSYYGNPSPGFTVNKNLMGTVTAGFGNKHTELYDSAQKVFANAQRTELDTLLKDAESGHASYQAVVDKWDSVITSEEFKDIVNNKSVGEGNPYNRITGFRHIFDDDAFFAEDGSRTTSKPKPVA